MGKEPSFNRRNVLKSAASGFSVLGIAGTAAGNPGRGRGRSGNQFDPKSEKEVGAFLDKLRATPEAARQEMIDDLTDREQAAVLAAMRPERYEIEDKIETQFTSPPHTISVTANSTLGAELWTLHHQIDWGTWDNQVESEAWLSVTDALYSGDGIIGSQSWVDGMEARKVGRVESTFNFDYKGISGGFVATPIVHVYGTDNGDYGVIETEDGQ